MFKRWKLLSALVVAALVGATATFSRADDRSPAALETDPRIAALLAGISPSRMRKIDERLVAFGTRNTFSVGSDRRRGIYPARDWVAEQFREIGKSSGGRLTVSFDTYTQEKTPRTPSAIEVSSVIATLRGDDPTRGTYVISSHLDSRNSDGNDATKDAPGADDNASGVCAVLEAARVMAPQHFAGTLIFVAYDGEEQGLFGSAHHAKLLRDAGVRVDADLNNDIIGASVGHGGENSTTEVRLFSEAVGAGADRAGVNRLGSENDSPGRELARFVKETGEAYVPTMHVNLIYRADRFLRGGDQLSFLEQGFPAVRFVEAHENFDHQHQDVRREGGLQYGDLMEFMDFEYLGRVAQLNVAALATLALAPPHPNVEMLNRELGYDTTLQWKPVAGAKRYELVWRSTTDSTWTHVRDVGAATMVTATGISKDDWLFGVRSVNAAGLRSVVGFPIPIR